ncbi:hypothetical protein CP082626L3_0823B, partial [Chlamydia psittaci 08-2626_L3]
IIAEATTSCGCEVPDTCAVSELVSTELVSTELVSTESQEFTCLN